MIEALKGLTVGIGLMMIGLSFFDLSDWRLWTFYAGAVIMISSIKFLGL
jgi:hypothetical protein